MSFAEDSIAHATNANEQGVGPGAPYGEPKSERETSSSWLEKLRKAISKNLGDVEPGEVSGSSDTDTGEPSRPKHLAGGGPAARIVTENTPDLYRTDDVTPFTLDLDRRTVGIVQNELRRLSDRELSQLEQETNRAMDFLQYSAAAGGAAAVVKWRHSVAMAARFALGLAGEMVKPIAILSMAATAGAAMADVQTVSAACPSPVLLGNIIQLSNSEMLVCLESSDRMTIEFIVLAEILNQAE